MSKATGNLPGLTVQGWRTSHHAVEICEVPIQRLDSSGRVRSEFLHLPRSPKLAAVMRINGTVEN